MFKVGPIGPTLLKGVSYYDLTVLSMSVSNKKSLHGWSELYPVLFWIFGEKNLTLQSPLTLSYSSIWNQNVPQEIPFFIWNQYSAIARKRSNTTAIIVRVKI